jgi:hypothetical protein
MQRTKTTSARSRKAASPPADQATGAHESGAEGGAPAGPKKRAPRKAPDAAARGAKAKAEKAQVKRTKPLNFRVTAEFRKSFKQAAAAEDVKKVELLERIFADWQSRRT